MVASIVWLIRYIRVEQTLWQLAGVLSFAILSLLLFKQSKDEKQSHKTFGKENHDYVQEVTRKRNKWILNEMDKGTQIILISIIIGIIIGAFTLFNEVIKRNP